MRISVAVSPSVAAVAVVVSSVVDAAKLDLAIAIGFAPAGFAEDEETLSLFVKDIFIEDVVEKKRLRSALSVRHGSVQSRIFLCFHFLDVLVQVVSVVIVRLFLSVFGPLEEDVRRAEAPSLVCLDCLNRARRRGVQ